MCTCTGDLLICTIRLAKSRSCLPQAVPPAGRALGFSPGFPGGSNVVFLKYVTLACSVSEIGDRVGISRDVRV